MLHAQPSRGRLLWVVVGTARDLHPALVSQLGQCSGLSGKGIADAGDCTKSGEHVPPVGRGDGAKREHEEELQKETHRGGC